MRNNHWLVHVDESIEYLTIYDTSSASKEGVEVLS